MKYKKAFIKPEDEIKHLRKVLRMCQKTLEQWATVDRKMLYPPQHDTGSINRETLIEVKKVLCPKKN